MKPSRKEHNFKRLAEIRSTLETVRANTQPIDGHQDPKSVEDCWDLVFDHLDKLILRELNEAAKRAVIKNVILPGLDIGWSGID